MSSVEASARAKLDDLAGALAGRGDDLRQVFLAMFPGGLRFLPVEVGRRRVWRIQGAARLGPLPGLPIATENNGPVPSDAARAAFRSTLSCDPNGI